MALIRLVHRFPAILAILALTHLHPFRFCNEPELSPYKSALNCPTEPDGTYVKKNGYLLFTQLIWGTLNIGIGIIDLGTIDKLILCPLLN
jgi:hypothetical protein